MAIPGGGFSRNALPCRWKGAGKVPRVPLSPLPMLSRKWALRVREPGCTVLTFAKKFNAARPLARRDRTGRQPPAENDHLSVGTRRWLKKYVRGQSSTTCPTRTSSRLRDGRSYEKASDPFAIDDDSEQQVLNFDPMPSPIPDTSPIVPTNQLVQLPFNSRMLFSYLFVLFCRRKLFRSLILRLKIVLFHSTPVLIPWRQTLIPQRAIAAIRCFELKNVSVISSVAAAGSTDFSLWTSQGLFRFIKEKIAWLKQLWILGQQFFDWNVDRYLWTIRVVAQFFEDDSVVADPVQGDAAPTSLSLRMLRASCRASSNFSCCAGVQRRGEAFANRSHH